MLASRAVLAAYAKKTLKPVEIIAIIVFVVFLLGTAYLIANVSPWWWLLMIVIGAYGVIGSILWLIIHFTLDKLTPAQTAAQKESVSIFITQAEKVADLTGITRFGLLLRVIRSVMAPQSGNILSDLAHDSDELRKTFQLVVSSFR